MMWLLYLLLGLLGLPQHPFRHQTGDHLYRSGAGQICQRPFADDPVRNHQSARRNRPVEI